MLPQILTATINGCETCGVEEGISWSYKRSYYLETRRIRSLANWISLTHSFASSCWFLPRYFIWILLRLSQHCTQVEIPSMYLCWVSWSGHCWPVANMAACQYSVPATPLHRSCHCSRNLPTLFLIWWPNQKYYKIETFTEIQYYPKANDEQL